MSIRARAEVPSSNAPSRLDEVLRVGMAFAPTDALFKKGIKREVYIAKLNQFKLYRAHYTRLVFNLERIGDRITDAYDRLLKDKDNIDSLSVLPEDDPKRQKARKTYSDFLAWLKEKKDNLLEPNLLVPDARFYIPFEGLQTPEKRKVFTKKEYSALEEELNECMKLVENFNEKWVEEEYESFHIRLRLLEVDYYPVIMIYGLPGRDTTFEGPEEDRRLLYSMQDEQRKKLDGTQMRQLIKLYQNEEVIDDKTRAMSGYNGNFMKTGRRAAEMPKKNSLNRYSGFGKKHLTGEEEFFVKERVRGDLPMPRWW